MLYHVESCYVVFYHLSLVQSGDLGWWFGVLENHNFLQSKIEVSWKLQVFLNRGANELNSA